VGAGYTGLWTAWALLRSRPDLDVVILDKEHVGFGASGRNGGWLSGLLPGDRARLAQGPGGRPAVTALENALRRAVDDVIEICADEEIDADIAKSGTLAVATNPAQLGRLRAEMAADRAWGATDNDIVELSAPELAERVTLAGALGATYSPHCARLHPAKLVRGLAQAVERRGGRIFEGSPASAVAPGRVTTPAGPVHARWVVRATEGFTAGLPGLRRALLPMNSSMVVTAPLGPGTWAAIGWDQPATLRTAAHAYLYAQRTADGRIAIGGRGVPYRWASGTDDRGRTHPATVRSLTTALHALWPATAEVPIEHAWCGVLGVARDWCPTVSVDQSSGLAWAGGYVGDGVATSHLAGRTLADLITGTTSNLTQLAWVGHRSRAWEPEPLRWLGTRGVYGLFRAADRAEVRGGPRPSSWARLAELVAGRH
jgi:glycine/D-amino acid oxidase-like deaminating enzyme